MSVIACSAWVPRGAAKEHPEKVELTGEELQQLIEGTAAQLKDLEAGSDEEEGVQGEEGEEEEEQSQGQSQVGATAAAAAAEVMGTSKKDNKKDKKDKKAGKKEKSAAGSKGDGEPVDELAEYNLDTYDDEDTDVVVGGLAKLTVFSSNADDPYMTRKDDEEDEVEDFSVQQSDNLVVVGHTEDALSHIEVYVYNEDDEDFFQHHDILLSSFPLCIEWLNFDPGAESPGNLLAVGSMSPQIEVWDLDVIDSVEPAFVLGDKVKKAKKGKKKGAAAHHGHTKEVMGLSWNRLQRNVLASSSADHTVRIWDLATGTSLRSLTHHNDKVQAVRWNPSSAPVLLTGSFDKSVAVLDSRAPQAVARFALGAALEACVWDPHQPSRFFASCENGMVYCGDSRYPGKTAFAIRAHDSPVSALAMSMHAPGMLVTGAGEEMVRVWDVQGTEPAFVVAHPVPDMSTVYTLSFSPELPFTVVAAGHRGGIRVLDLASTAAVQRRFYERLSSRPPNIHKDLSSSMGPERETLEDMMADDDDDDDDDDEEGGWEDAGEAQGEEGEMEEEGEDEDGNVGEGVQGMSVAAAAVAGGESTQEKKKKKKKKPKSKKGKKTE